MSESSAQSIVLYVRYTSAVSLQAIEFFKRRNVEFTVYDIAENELALQEMVRLSGQREVPVIVIDGMVLTGFDMAQLGKLFPLEERPRVQLGMSIASVKESDMYPLGAFVGSVKPGSLAERAGIQKGDIIVEMAQRPIHSAADIHALLPNLLPGEAIPLTIWRAGRTFRASVRA